MAVSKKEEFSEIEIQLADFAKALSHPARIKILEILTKLDICMCGDIVDHLPLSQSTVSQHLKELKRVGFIKGEVEGAKVCYCVNKKILKQFVKLFENKINKLTETLNKSRSC